MPRDIMLNISMPQEFEYDAQTQRYIVSFKDFPAAIATGKTEDEAEQNLIFLVEDMWKRRAQDLKDFLLHNYGSHIQIQSSAKC